jgi:hypothetical protein
MQTLCQRSWLSQTCAFQTDFYEAWFFEERPIRSKTIVFKNFRYKWPDCVYFAAVCRLLKTHFLNSRITDPSEKAIGVCTDVVRYAPMWLEADSVQAKALLFF